MLKFFRNIRHRLFQSGKLRSYVLYAIGEILLVVIGILIALQINNWNEDRKALQLSHKILVEIKGNLQYNIQKAREEIAAERIVIQSIDHISEEFFEAQKYSDTLNGDFLSAFYWPPASWRISGYETLKSQGVDLIQSEELRSGIIDLFEIKYNELAESIRSAENYSQASAMITLFKFKYQFPVSTGGLPTNAFGAEPLDIQALQQSQDVYGFLSFWKVLRIQAIEVRNHIIAQSESIIKKIDKELNR